MTQYRLNTMYCIIHSTIQLIKAINIYTRKQDIGQIHQMSPPENISVRNSIASLDIQESFIQSRMFFPWHIATKTFLFGARVRLIIRLPFLEMFLVKVSPTTVHVYSLYHLTVSCYNLHVNCEHRDLLRLVLDCE